MVTNFPKTEEIEPQLHNAVPRAGTKHTREKTAAHSRAAHRPPRVPRGRRQGQNRGPGGARTAVTPRHRRPPARSPTCG